MNRKEWKELCITDHKTAYFWYNKVKRILKSKEFESDERTHKDESKLKMSVARSEYLVPIRNAYKEYKANNGTMKWVEFCKDYAAKHPTNKNKPDK